MRKTLGMLVILLAAQLVLAVGMSFTGPNLDAHRADAALLDLGERSVDRVTIEGPDNQQLVLARHGTDWVLPGSGDFPADKAAVERLLERLRDLRRGLAVATTAGAQQRFKVSDSAFERRVTLASNDTTLATLYFGTSPGMRQVHARAQGDEVVYTTGFSIYEAPLKAADWEDKTLLQVPPDKIASIGVAGLTLVRHGTSDGSADAGTAAASAPGQATWSAADLQGDATLDPAGAAALAQQLATLTFGAVLGQEAQPDYGLQAPVLTFSVQRQGGESIEYRLGKRDRHDDYVLKVSARPEYFRLPGFTAQALIKAASRDELVSTATAAGASAQDPDEPVSRETAPVPDQAAAAEGAP